MRDTPVHDTSVEERERAPDVTIACPGSGTRRPTFPDLTVGIKRGCPGA